MQRKRSATGESFNSATALEDLRCRVTEIEALAHAACQEAAHLPGATEANARRAIGRVQALVQTTAEVARAVLDEADEMVANIGDR
jgi:hypothetical protein